MLSMLEEVVLLAVDEKSGKLRSSRDFGPSYALIGALFFDLALARRIDTDLDTIRVVDKTETGSHPHDRVLAELARRPEVTTVRSWIEEMFRRRDDLEGEALASLIERGILRHEKSKMLWIIDVERFPMVDKKRQQHVKLRLAEAILTDQIPETRDIMLVSIAEPCGLLNAVLGSTELENRRDRVRLLCNLETISRTVTEAIATLDVYLRQAMMTRLV
jgi:Golgi phosphoprotein 3